jgi:hypothetical protein
MITTTIRRLHSRRARSAPAASGGTIHHGIAILASSAIVSVERSRGDRIHVFGIERLTGEIVPVIRRLAELEADPAAHFHVGSMGSGGALWDTLRVNGGVGRGSRRWHLYDRVGRDRQDLVRGLLNAEAEGRLTFDRSLPEWPAMRKALASLTREVKEDGILGGEIVVALALVVIGRTPPRPRIY